VPSIPFAWTDVVTAVDGFLSAGRGERIQLVVEPHGCSCVCESCDWGLFATDGASVFRVAGQVGSSEFAHYFCFSCLLVFLAQYGLVGFSVVVDAEKN